MDIQEEFKKIDAHFDSISPETLVSDLIECGLGSIRDCTESGWELEEQAETEPDPIKALELRKQSVRGSIPR